MDQFARRGTDGGASPGDNDIQYRLIFETVFDGLEVIDAETGRIVLANQAAATTFGFGSPEEMVGLDPLDYIPREDRQLVARMIAEHLFEKNVHEVIELRCETKDGRLVWLSAIGVRTEYQGKPAGLVSMRDITRQKLAEEQLRRSEAENRLLIENANQGIVVVQDGVMRFVNPYVMAISGYPMEELISKPFVEFIHSDDREMVAGQYLRRIEGKETLSAYQFRFVTKEGKARWGETNVIYYTWDGKPAVLAFLADVTERKQTEQREYKTLISSAMDSFCVTDAQGRLLDVNDACCSLLGYSREELMNMHIGDIEAIETAEQPGQRIRKIMQVGKDRFETRLRRQDTKIIDVEASVNSMDSEGGRVFIFLRDITERKKAEEALQASEKRYRLLAENLSDVIWTMDTNLRYTYMSPSVTRLRGYSVEEATALSMEETMTPASLQTALRVMAEAEAKEGIGSDSQPSSVTLELELNCKDGSTVWVENRVTYLRDVEGRLTGYQGVSLDITARRKAEEAIRKSEERFRRAIDATEDGLWEWNTQTNQEFFSPRWCEIVGYSFDDPELPHTYKSWESRIHPDDHDRVLSAMANHLEKGTRYDVEYRHRHKSGEYHWQHSKGQAVIDESGEPVTMVGCISDITERKKAEEALLASEKRYRLLAENVSDVIWVVDMNLQPTYLSPSITRMTGYSVEEAMARGLGKGLTPAEIEAVSEIVMAELARKGEPNTATRLTSVTVGMEHKDGSRLWAESTGTLLRGPDGQPVEIVGVLRDITKRKRAEEQLQHQERYFRAITERSSDVVVVLSKDGVALYVSPTVEHMLGITREQAEGAGFTNSVHPDDIPKVAEDWAYLMEHPGGTRKGERRLQHADGSWRYVEAIGYSLLDDPAVGGVVINIRDITELKLAEARQQQAQAQLALSSRLASIGQLASGVAHEINNPLSIVIGCSQMLMEKGVPKDIQEDIDMVHDSAQRVAEIVKGLLVFARQSRPGKSYVDINAVVSRVVGLRAPEMRINDIMVSTRLDPDLPRTMVDEGQMQQVFLNIVVNAEQAMTEAHAEGHLRIKTERIGDNIRISFKDDGIGISEEHMPRLFDPFFTTKQVGEGTGLGLSISYGIIREHQGNIYVRGKPGKGATFVVELPIVAKPDDLESLEEGPAKDLKRKPTGRILVVDDEPALCRMLARLLTQDGHNVETAGDANAALKKMKRKRFSLVLADVKMKGMSGIELYEHLGKTDQSMQRRVIFITGDTLARGTRDFLEKTKAPYISKPFDVEHVKETVKQMLAKM